MAKEGRRRVADRHLTDHDHQHAPTRIDAPDPPPARLNTPSVGEKPARRHRSTSEIDVSANFHAGILAEAPDDIVRRPLRQSPATPPEEERTLAVRRAGAGPGSTAGGLPVEATEAGRPAQSLGEAQVRASAGGRDRVDLQ